MPKIIALYGPDRVGKSTMAAYLSATTKLPIQHFGVPVKDIIFHQYYDFFETFSGDVILDRCWLDECYYSRYGCASLNLPMRKLLVPKSSDIRALMEFLCDRHYNQVIQIRVDTPETLVESRHISELHKLKTPSKDLGKLLWQRMEEHRKINTFWNSINGSMLSHAHAIQKNHYILNTDIEASYKELEWILK